MTFQQFTLAFTSAGCFFFGTYYLLAVIYIHKKIFDKHFYFLIACFACSSYIISQLLLSLKFSDEQYVFFHNLKAISVFIVTPTFFLAFYDIFFPSAKKNILYALILFLPIQIVLALCGYCFTLPVRLVEINTPLSVFIYHLGTSNFGYLFWVVPTGVAVFLSILYYLFSKKKGKRIQFVIIMILMIFVLGNDTSISRGLINSLYLAEYSYFILIASILLEFLKEDRKTYFSVLELSKHLQKEKNEVIDLSKELKHEKEEAIRRLRITEIYTLKSLVESIEKGEDPTKFESKNIQIATLFSDIRDFTGITEGLPPLETVELLNAYFNRMNSTIIKHNGEIDKLMGDCIMALFKNPDDALKSAIDMRYELAKFNTTPPQPSPQAGLTIIHKYN
jgi:hypothetical protein